MEQFKCAHCGARKNETEILITTKYNNGRKVLKRVCTLCISKTMPNPLRKRVTQLWVLVACLAGILSYLLAYKIF